MSPDFSRPVLAIDTSTSFLSLALRVHGRVCAYHADVGSRQSELVLPQIRNLFSQAGISAADLGAIVYAQGAGAFTGLRIGLGVAQGMATPFSTPLVGIPCQDAAAYLIPDCRCVLAATDARMGEVFYAFFDTQNHVRLSGYRVGKAADIRQPENITANEVSGIGNAYALDEPPPFSGSPDMPAAADYLNLAATGRYPAAAPQDAALLYVRNKIALTAAEQAARRKAA